MSSDTTYSGRKTTNSSIMSSAPPATQLIFVGGPFKLLLDPLSGLVPMQHRERYLSLIDVLANLGFETYSAHQREAWGAMLMPPEQCTELDYQALRRSTLFVAFIGDPPSPGTLVEIGWASSMGKPIILLLEPDQDLPALVAGIHVIAPTRYLDAQTIDPSKLGQTITELLIDQ